MPGFVYSFTGVPGTTTRIITDDEVVQLDAALLAERTGFVAVEVTVAGNSIRYAFGVNPVQGAAAVGLGHVLPVNGSLRIANLAAARNLRMINQVAQSNAEITYTVEFERSG